MTLENLRQKIVKSVSNYIFYCWDYSSYRCGGYFCKRARQSHTFSVFISPISKDLNLSATAISSAYGLATLVAALGLPMVGRLVDMHGARRVMGTVVVLLGFACIAFGFAPGLIWLALDLVRSVSLPRVP